MRFEAKHRYFKQLAQTVGCFKNKDFGCKTPTPSVSLAILRTLKLDQVQNIDIFNFFEQVLMRETKNPSTHKYWTCAHFTPVFGQGKK